VTNIVKQNYYPKWTNIKKQREYFLTIL